MLGRLVELYRIERGDHHRKREGAFPIDVLTIDLEAHLKLVLQFLLPLADLTCRADH